MPTDAKTSRDVTEKILQDCLVGPFGLVAADPMPEQCRHAQEALIAAKNSASNALTTALVMNRVDKLSRGVPVSGAYGDTAQDAMRAALLFAGAGLDQALKRLVDSALVRLVAVSGPAQEKFEQWSQQAIAHPETGGVDPKRLVELLLGSGATPRDVLMRRYSTSLTASSAQSVERVEQLAAALGVTDPKIRKRCKPGAASALKAAFVARNEVSHELDLLDAPAGARARFERRRRSRRFEDMWDHANECLQVTQLVINDVAARLDT